MKIVLYLLDGAFQPFGDITDILSFRIAGKTVIQHMLQLLHDVKAGGSLLVTSPSIPAKTLDKAVRAAAGNDPLLNVETALLTDLPALLQAEEKVVLLDGLLFPSRSDLLALLDQHVDKQSPAVMIAGKGGHTGAGVFLIGQKSIGTTVECLTGSNTSELTPVLIDHLVKAGMRPEKTKVTIPLFKLEYPWHLLSLQEIIMKEIASDPNIINGDVEPGATLKGTGIIIEKGALIRSGSYLIGPVIISENAVTGPNCYIRPYTFVDRKATIGNAVEIKNSIIGERTHIGHLSYVGDSIIGRNCNFGAGTKVANLKFNNNAVRADYKGERLSTGRRKLGVMMGDGVKTGINASLMPGVILGSESVVGAGFLLQHNLGSGRSIYMDKDMKTVERERNKGR